MSRANTTRFGLDGEVQSLYVQLEYQRRGIGSALLGLLLEWLTSHGCTSVCVGIESRNPYRAFYLKHGAEYLNPHWLVWRNTAQLQASLVSSAPSMAKWES